MQRVSNYVITTCLGDQSMKALDRARILEHWIEVARECQVLQNFMSLHAILFALWSKSTQHLKQTWKEASRDSIYHLQVMSKTSLKRELPGQPTVPHLWMLLSEPASLQLAPTDSQEEYKVIPRIGPLQEGCTYFHFWPLEEFKAWFGSMEQFSAPECYHLSCEWEPLALLASNTPEAPNSQKLSSLEAQGEFPFQTGRCSCLRAPCLFGLSITSGHQDLSTEPSCSGASLPSVRFQLGCDLSSGVAAISLPGCEANASKSDLEMSLGLISKCPDGQEKQIGDLTSDHPQPGAPLSTPRTSGSLPFYNKQVGDLCIVHISLDGDHVNMPKSIVGCSFLMMVLSSTPWTLQEIITYF
ncbi:ral guanine nucleotide dissociation stimulator-like isoform X2 [Tamandua tetradactyla]|uniref:ral guanine nucleotide dissociation stimulator-like isoform X2 n=1 Tax=Tamandua tetradactyla TaxID=48850 RepID=UPI0040546ACB